MIGKYFLLDRSDYEKAIEFFRFNTGNYPNSAEAYAYLGREQDAEKALTEHMKRRRIKDYTVERVLKIYLYAFKDPKDTVRFAQGLHKAGLPMK